MVQLASSWRVTDLTPAKMTFLATSTPKPFKPDMSTSLTAIRRMASCPKTYNCLEYKPSSMSFDADPLFAISEEVATDSHFRFLEGGSLEFSTISALDIGQKTKQMRKKPALNNATDTTWTTYFTSNKGWSRFTNNSARLSVSYETKNTSRKRRQCDSAQWGIWFVTTVCTCSSRCDLTPTDRACPTPNRLPFSHPPTALGTPQQHRFFKRQRDRNQLETTLQTYLFLILFLIVTSPVWHFKRNFIRCGLIMHVTFVVVYFNWFAREL